MSESTPIYSSMADSKPLYADSKPLYTDSTPAFSSDVPVQSIETGSSSTGAKVESAKNTVINSMVGFASTS